MREIKIAYIGGGSRSWAWSLMKDLARSRHITGEIVLYDIDHAAAEQNARIGEQIFALPGVETKFSVRGP